MIIPDKLKPGDEIRVISPATSLGVIPDEQREDAERLLNSLGFKVTYSRYAFDVDAFRSATVEKRVQDLHDAFRDPNVKAMLTTLGGYNSNQMLEFLDYDLIRTNPKILCGYSDITALGNAVYAKTGLVTYSGPHFSTFAMHKGLEKTIEGFQQCLMDEEIIDVKPSETWSDDAWYLDQDNRHFIENDGWQVITEGEGEGMLLGGNQCTLNLLQGTPYMPSLADSILFLEDDELVDAPQFDRDLQSLVHQPEFDRVRGVVIGRFQTKSKIASEDIRYIVRSKKALCRVPVIANVDFGHTYPFLTFPIGGYVKINASEREASIKITNH